MTIEWADWVIPAVSFAALVFWTANLRGGLRRIRAGIPSPDLRIVTLATLSVVALALTWSSLLYPDLIGVEASRWGIATARIALLIGGVAVWWMARRETA